MRESVSHWNQYKYLKQRHWLVEMRREQYTLRDTYKQTIFSTSSDDFCATPTYDFDAGIEVLPLGLKQKNILSGVVFRKWADLNPMNTPNELLEDISKLYWQKQAYKPDSMQQYFDFRELEHVY